MSDNKRKPKSKDDPSGFALLWLALLTFAPIALWYHESRPIEPNFKVGQCIGHDYGDPTDPECEAWRKCFKGTTTYLKVVAVGKNNYLVERLRDDRHFKKGSTRELKFEDQEYMKAGDCP